MRKKIIEVDEQEVNKLAADYHDYLDGDYDKDDKIYGLAELAKALLETLGVEVKEYF